MHYVTYQRYGIYNLIRTSAIKSISVTNNFTYRAFPLRYIERPSKVSGDSRNKIYLAIEVTITICAVYVYSLLETALKSLKKKTSLMNSE